MDYSVHGLTGAVSAAGSPLTVCQLWNPSSTRRIRLLGVSVFWRDFDIAGVSFYLQRTTARGTPGSTVTPDGDNSSGDTSPPPSGALLDLCTFTVNPTLATPELMALGTMHTASGGGFDQPITRGIIVPAGTGIAVQFRSPTPPIGLNNGGECRMVFED